MAARAEEDAGMTLAQFESERRKIALRLLEKTDQFLGWDLEFNKHISKLAGILVEYVEKNPKILESNSNIRDIISDIEKKTGQNPGVSGGDVIGGGVWDDVWGFISGLVKEEKEFIKEIIRFILGMN
jgi:hypothetical protein